MHFEKVNLINYRNFKSLKVSFSNKVNVFLGQNGQGKTNLLEALYLTTHGDSFRYSDNSTLIMNNEESCSVMTEIFHNEMNDQLRVEILKSKKNYFLNKKKVSSTEIRKRFASIIFSPESLSSIKECADERRTFVDDLLVTFEKNNSDLIYEYKKTLKTKNKILKNLVDNSVDKQTTLDLLESINPIFLNYATQLTYKRIQAILSLEKDFNQAMKYISSNQNKEITVKYVASDQNILHWEQNQIEKFIALRMMELKDAELHSGNCLVGPHKHDIQFLYDGNDSRFFCSQGQQRAIILSFKMAQIVYHRKVHGIYPILMLDDVLSELDIEKRKALIQFLHEINTQIFITTTDLNLPYSFSMDQISVLKINEGSIESSR